MPSLIKMEVAVSFEMSVTLYKTTRRPTADTGNLCKNVFLGRQEVSRALTNSNFNYIIMPGRINNNNNNTNNNSLYIIQTGRVTFKKCIIL